MTIIVKLDQEVWFTNNTTLNLELQPGLQPYYFITPNFLLIQWLPKTLQFLPYLHCLIDIFVTSTVNPWTIGEPWISAFIWYIYIYHHRLLLLQLYIILYLWCIATVVIPVDHTKQSPRKEILHSQRSLFTKCKHTIKAYWECCCISLYVCMDSEAKIISPVILFQKEK